jgi:hypothetical protein
VVLEFLKSIKTAFTIQKQKVMIKEKIKWLKMLAGLLSNARKIVGKAMESKMPFFRSYLSIILFMPG